jgi:chromosome segregation ATPase
MAEAETKAATTVLTKNQKKKKRKYNVKQRFIAAAAEQREQDEQRDQENVELQRSLEQVNHSSKAKIKELEQELERANRSINALANDKALLERRFSKVYGKLHKICDKYCKYVRSHIINRIIIFN